MTVMPFHEKHSERATRLSSFERAASVMQRRVRRRKGPMHSLTVFMVVPSSLGLVRVERLWRLAEESSTKPLRVFSRNMLTLPRHLSTTKLVSYMASIRLREQSRKKIVFIWWRDILMLSPCINAA